MNTNRMGWAASLTLPVLLLAGCGPTDRQRDVVTTGSLYEQMIDLAGLAEFPDPAYKTVQFSSYDRRSSVPGGPGWFIPALQLEAVHGRRSPGAGLVRT